MSQPFTSFQDFKRRYPIRPNDEGALLGSGSYGRVIKVEDQLETEWVAIKISEFKGNDPKSLKAEVELAQRIARQANIARYDACYRLETDTSISDFAIMKYYQDGNLADLLRRQALTPAQIYDITKGILLGLQHLHRHRIVHRDFKPANILISRDNAGRFIPKIADFGLSKLVSDDELDSSDFDLSDGRGTPSYKAPEQIEGSRVSFNLDLWAFGVILYELLTGEKPFQADLRNSSEQSARREIEKKIITVDLPARVKQIEEPYQTMIRRCLVRDIHERVRKEDELLDLLDNIPQLLSEAQKRADRHEYEKAIPLFEQILTKREHHAAAQKGLESAKLGVNRQQLKKLLTEATNLTTQHRFEQAKTLYEQVLRLSPDLSEAIEGLTFCIEQLRPKSLVVQDPERTDMYQEDATDVYVAPSVIPAPATTVPKQPVLVEKDTPKKPVLPPVVAVPVSDGMLQQPAIPKLGKPFPWRIVAPVAIGLGAVVIYFNVSSGPTGTSNVAGSKTSTATLAPATPKSSAPDPKTEAGSAPLTLGEKKSALKEQVDEIFNAARRAFQKKNFKQTTTLTASALQLDPTRQDVSRLHSIALQELAKSGVDAPKENEKPIAVVAAPVLTSESPKPVVAESTKESAKETTGNAKQQAQSAYDQLIEDGRQAIAKGNNKAKAIADFSSARALAKEHDLNTTKADEAYNTYLSKGNKIFDSDDFDAAKEWYKVAQSLKETREVQSKIKQCNNQ
ncbi:serine/threonine-protein kinase [Spirosoma oryzicola]|uniref:serine/threonine-protein kinase n=1 Tax=Spirosoma oryzicola TaxID=2898794 RepID=UPI001E507A6D|nr:serine/threonine-protein kinase [Spirosoma oryzicola]UHG91054.1 serine/threonine protein kinase [Spirosoma oryzicola]